MKINGALSESALRCLGDRIGLGLMETAHGVIRIVTGNMVKAIRTISIERGFDPKEFSLLAFGGAGPLHAVGVARELDISKVIVPLNPGILCAMGLIVADARNDYVKTSLMEVDTADTERINQTFEHLEREARQWLAQEGFDSSAQRLSRSVDMRYVGQNFELPVEVPAHPLKASDLETLISRFYVEHEKNYGHFMPGEPMQFVSFRVTAQGIIPKLQLQKIGHRRQKGVSSEVGRREVYFNARAPLPTPVYDRARLCPGDRIKGPAVIEQMDSTTLIYPEDGAEIDDLLNIIITIREDKA